MMDFQVNFIWLFSTLFQNNLENGGMFGDDDEDEEGEEEEDLNGGDHYEEEDEMADHWFDPFNKSHFNLFQINFIFEFW